MMLGRRVAASARPRWAPQRRFSSTPPSSDGLSHWRAFGYPYMLRRGWGVASRVCGRWPQFIDYYERGVFAPSASDESRSRMFVLTCMPRATTVDLFEFLTGATHAVRSVYAQLYAQEKGGITYPDVHIHGLDDVVSNHSVLSTFARKPQRQAQQLAVHAEPRKTKLVLEGLDIRSVGLASVDYHMQQLPEAKAADLGYHEDEWLRLEVEYNVVEHVRISAAENTQAIDDHQTFETSFTWTFASNVSDPTNLEWTIVDATEFVETSAVVKRTPQRPLG